MSYENLKTFQGCSVGIEENWFLLKKRVKFGWPSYLQMSLTDRIVKRNFLIVLSWSSRFVTLNLCHSGSKKLNFHVFFHQKHIEIFDRGKNMKF